MGPAPCWSCWTADEPSACRMQCRRTGRCTPGRWQGRDRDRHRPAVGADSAARRRGASEPAVEARAGLVDRDGRSHPLINAALVHTVPAAALAPLPNTATSAAYRSAPGRPRRPRSARGRLHQRARPQPITLSGQRVHAPRGVDAYPPPARPTGGRKGQNNEHGVDRPRPHRDDRQPALSAPAGSVPAARTPRPPCTTPLSSVLPGTITTGLIANDLLGKSAAQTWYATPGELTRPYLGTVTASLPTRKKIQS